MSRADATSRKGERGFVLIEALFALGILAATLVLVNATFAAGWRTQLRTEHEATALRLARSLLAEAAVTAPPRAGVSTGSEGDIAWRVELAPYRAGDAGDAIPRVPAWWVLVEVSWQDGRGAGERTLKLTTVKLAAGRP